MNKHSSLNKFFYVCLFAFNKPIHRKWKNIGSLFIFNLVDNYGSVDYSTFFDLPKNGSIIVGNK